MRAIIDTIKFLRIYILMFLMIFGVISYCEISYSFSDFSSYTSVLISVSGMVFTIMGIWIAFIYPNALQKIVNPDKIENVDFSEGLEDTKRLESIVGSVLKSATVIIILMTIFLLKLIFYKTNIYLSYKDFFKYLSLSIIIVLSYAQIEAVFQVILSNIKFIEDLHSKREQNEIDEDI
ncbi:hypothetical protein PGS49_12220 [Yersinia intermedia]|uniref:hypothetical protein n=1 Tax=Yersinia intermedia TaxID=631 RepID=UPI0022FE7E13|nr:hypothetical protein [Yersinia intermedia]MDA5481420.1 hypothetical protein [Yersinia intermedia]